MANKPSAAWKAAFLESPGPRSMGEAVVLMLKGFCMGIADTIPGVSGGTIALITGIYEDLLAAIKSVDAKMIGRLFRLDFRAALAGFHARFILSLFLGIATAILTLARVMSYLIQHYPVPTWSLFFGLIAASVWVVGRQVEKWTTGTGISVAAGAAAGLLIVNLVPVATPEALWFIFFSGMIAICAMILPGISGAFILLILGKYEFIIATLKNPFLPENMVVIAVFAVGCAVGLAGFARFLKLLLTWYHALTLAFLTGLMAGSMWKIWPWKQVLETAMIGGKLRVLREKNILPEAVDGDVLFAVALMAAGFLAVLALERLSRKRHTD
jgi:putative membrane protein